MLRAIMETVDDMQKQMGNINRDRNSKKVSKGNARHQDRNEKYLWWIISGLTEKEMATHSNTLAWRIHGQRSLVGRTRLSDFTFTFHFHALEKEMTTHSSVLAWRIPGTGEPGGLPSMGSHRVGYDWSDSAAAVDSTWPMKKICDLEGRTIETSQPGM